MITFRIVVSDSEKTRSLSSSRSPSPRKSVRNSTFSHARDYDSNRAFRRDKLSQVVRESSYTKSIGLREGLYGIQITSVTLQGMMFLLVEIERLRSTQRLAWRNLDNSRINWFVNCSEISQESQDVFDVEVDTIRSRKPVSPIHVVGSHASLVRIARTW